MPRQRLLPFPFFAQASILASSWPLTPGVPQILDNVEDFPVCSRILARISLSIGQSLIFDRRTDISRKTLLLIIGLIRNDITSVSSRIYLQNIRFREYSISIKEFHILREMTDINSFIYIVDTKNSHFIKC